MAKKGTSNGHGGMRVGAGRKKRADPKGTYHLVITHEQAALLRMWGGGDLSAGLRWMVDVAEILVRRIEYPPLIGGSHPSTSTTDSDPS